MTRLFQNPNIDDINDNNDENSHKTSSLWTYVDCKNPAYPSMTEVYLDLIVTQIIYIMYTVIYI